MCIILFHNVKRNKLLLAISNTFEIPLASQPALHMRPTRVPNGFLYGAFVGSLYGPQSDFANGFLMEPIWFVNMGNIWAPYGAFIVK